MTPDVGFIDNAALQTLEEFKAEVEADADRAALYAPAYYEDSAAFLASAEVWSVGKRINARTGEVWDVVSSGEHFTHPVSGIKLRVVETVGGVSIRTFNPVGDGTADDSAVVAVALAAVDHLIFDGGTYKFHNLTCTRPGQIIECRYDGQIKLGAANNYMLRAEGANAIFRNIIADGQGFTDTSGTRSGCIFFAANDVTVDGGWFDDFQNALTADSTAQVTGYNILNPLITNVVAPAGGSQSRSAGIFMVASRGRIINSTVRGKAGDFLLHGIKVEALLQSDPDYEDDPMPRREKVLIHGAFVEGEFTHGIYVEGVGRTHVADSQIYGCASNAIKVGGSNTTWANIVCESVDAVKSWVFDPETILVENGHDNSFTNITIECRKARSTADIAGLTDKNAVAIDATKGLVIKADAGNTKVRGLHVLRGAPYTQRVVLSGSSGTFTEGTANVVTDANGWLKAANVVEWDGTGKVLTYAQTSGFAIVGDVLTQSGSGATGTVASIQYDLGRLYKAVEMPSASRDVEIADFFFERGVCEEGIDAAASATRLTIGPGRIDAPSGEGINIGNSAVDLDIDRVKVRDAGSNGIQTGTGTGRITNSKATGCGARGIDAVGTDLTLFDGNEASGNSTSQISFRSSATVAVLGSNPGYVSQASGIAVVLSGTSSLSVSHGLATTPKSVTVSATEDPNAVGAARTWADTIGASSFIIRVDANTTGDYSVAWRADLATI